MNYIKQLETDKAEAIDTARTIETEINNLGFFQQRYVKRHAIYHKPDIHNEIRLFAAPTIRPPSGR